MKLHSIAIACFLVLSHIAMIAGMTSPAVLGWQNPNSMGHMNMEQQMEMTRPPMNMEHSMPNHNEPMNHQH